MPNDNFFALQCDALAEQLDALRDPDLSTRQADLEKAQGAAEGLALCVRLAAAHTLAETAPEAGEGALLKAEPEDAREDDAEAFDPARALLEALSTARHADEYDILPVWEGAIDDAMQALRALRQTGPGASAPEVPEDFDARLTLFRQWTQIARAMAKRWQRALAEMDTLTQAQALRLTVSTVKDMLTAGIDFQIELIKSLYADAHQMRQRVFEATGQDLDAAGAMLQMHREFSLLLNDVEDFDKALEGMVSRDSATPQEARSRRRKDDFKFSSREGNSARAVSSAIFDWTGDSLHGGRDPVDEVYEELMHEPSRWKKEGADGGYSYSNAQDSIEDMVKRLESLFDNLWLQD